MTPEVGLKNEASAHAYSPLEYHGIRHGFAENVYEQ